MTLPQYVRKVAEILGGETSTFCNTQFGEVVRKSDGRQVGLFGPDSGKRNWRKLNDKIIARLEAEKNQNATAAA